MSKYTKQERHEIYKEAKKIHLKDIKRSKECLYSLDGMCSNLGAAIYKIHKHSYIKLEEMVENLPEFLALKPKYVNIDNYWWNKSNTSRIRITKYDLIIKQTKN